MDKVILLDRDGVINYDSDSHIKTPEEWHAIPNSLDAIAKLYNANYRIIVVTNQSGVGRGLYTEAALHNIHAKFLKELKTYNGQIEKIYYCPHTPTENCSCRKPRPGLLQQAAHDLNFSLENSIVIGDSLRDIQAGKVVHAKTILVKTGNGETTWSLHHEELQETLVTENLSSAVDFILANPSFSNSK